MRDMNNSRIVKTFFIRFLMIEFDTDQDSSCSLIRLQLDSKVESRSLILVLLMKAFFEVDIGIHGIVLFSVV